MVQVGQRTEARVSATCGSTSGFAVAQAGVYQRQTKTGGHKERSGIGALSGEC